MCVAMPYAVGAALGLSLDELFEKSLPNGVGLWIKQTLTLVAGFAGWIASEVWLGHQLKELLEAADKPATE
jgi:hypothetical protein